MDGDAPDKIYKRSKGSDNVEAIRFKYFQLPDTFKDMVEEEASKVGKDGLNWLSDIGSKLKSSGMTKEQISGLLNARVPTVNDGTQKQMLDFINQLLETGEIRKPDENESKSERLSAGARRRIRQNGNRKDPSLANPASIIKSSDKVYKLNEGFELMPLRKKKNPGPITNEMDILELDPNEKPRNLLMKDEEDPTSETEDEKEENEKKFKNPPPLTREDTERMLNKLAPVDIKDMFRTPAPYKNPIKSSTGSAFETIEPVMQRKSSISLSIPFYCIFYGLEFILMYNIIQHYPVTWMLFSVACLLLSLQYIYSICYLLEWLWLVVGYLSRLVFKSYIYQYFLPSGPIHFVVLSMSMCRSVIVIAKEYSQRRVRVDGDEETDPNERVKERKSGRTELGPRPVCVVYRHMESLFSLAVGMVTSLTLMYFQDGRAWDGFGVLVYCVGCFGAWAELELECQYLSANRDMDMIDIQQEIVARFLIVPMHIKRCKSQDSTYYNTIFPNVIVK